MWGVVNYVLIFNTCRAALTGRTQHHSFPWGGLGHGGSGGEKPKQDQKKVSEAHDKVGWQ